MTPHVKSVGRATIMAVVQKERPVPKIRTQESSRPQARTIGVSQNLVIERVGGEGGGKRYKLPPKHCHGHYGHDLGREKTYV